MLFGLGAYVVYRRFVEGTSLTKRVTVTERALTKEIADVEFRSILVPVFGTELDDDIVGTAGRLAAAEHETSDGDEEKSSVHIVHVVEVPLTLPIDAELPPEREQMSQRVVERAKEVAEEYENLEVTTEIVRAREVGAGIVEAANRAGAEVIVMGGEPPSKIRGGAVLGGIGAARPAEVGAATEYVLKKASSRVLLTAPPATPDPDDEEGEEGGETGAASE